MRKKKAGNASLFCPCSWASKQGTAQERKKKAGNASLFCPCSWASKQGTAQERKKKAGNASLFCPCSWASKQRAQERKTRVISQIEEVCRLDLNDYVLYLQLYNSFFFNTSLSFTLSLFFSITLLLPLLLLLLLLLPPPLLFLLVVVVVVVVVVVEVVVECYRPTRKVSSILLSDCLSHRLCRDESEDRICYKQTIFSFPKLDSKHHNECTSYLCLFHRRLLQLSSPEFVAQRVQSSHEKCSELPCTSCSFLLYSDAYSLLLWTCARYR